MLVLLAEIDSSAAMGFQEEYDFELLRNDAERRVIQEQEQQTRGLDERWRSQEAILDMAAYALNRVRPRYRVTLLGTLYTRAASDEEYPEEIRRRVAEAVQKVIDNP